MNFQPLIDNLPALLAALGFFLWTAARFVEAKAKANPDQDAWDELAPRVKWVSSTYAQAIEWLVATGAQKWTGAQKLEELNRRVGEFEKLWDDGKYVEALANLSGFYQSAKSKLEKVFPHPFVSTPTPAPVPRQGGAVIGPDDQAVETPVGPGNGEVK